jgi:hypothetical protein
MVRTRATRSCLRIRDQLAADGAVGATGRDPRSGARSGTTRCSAASRSGRSLYGAMRGIIGDGLRERYEISGQLPADLERLLEALKDAHLLAHLKVSHCRQCPSRCLPHRDGAGLPSDLTLDYGGKAEQACLVSLSLSALAWSGSDEDQRLARNAAKSFFSCSVKPMLKRWS